MKRTRWLQANDDYLVPSGAGTRIITCVAAPMSVDTGEPLPDFAGPEMADQLRTNVQASHTHLTAHTDAAAEELANA